MSQRIIPARQPHHQVMVGWDPPLSTFFATAVDTANLAEDGDPMPLMWTGNKPVEVSSIERLVEDVRPYAAITPEMQVQLAADRYVNDGRLRNHVPDQLAAAVLAACKGDATMARDALEAVAIFELTRRLA